MSDSSGSRTPTLEAEWEDLTDEHEDRRESVESNIDTWPDDIAQASYIIGAIGAGKTQLLAHLFKYAYVEAGKPALYVTMGQLLDEVATEIGYPAETDVLSQEQLHEVIETIAIRRLSDIRNKLENGEEFERNDYLMDSGRISDLDIYAETLGLSRSEFEEIVSNEEEIILIVDEMEESYDRLGEMVAQTTGPLREVVERVENRDSSFYLLGGFGYASVHELGEAEYRRIDPVTLPIIRPQSVRDVLGADISATRKNFVWWMSRGRPGWLEIANEGYDMGGQHVSGSYENLAEIPNLAMSRVDIVAMEELEEYVSDLGTEERDQTAYTIFRPAPVNVTEVDGLENDALQSSNPLLLADSGLVEIDAVIEAFLDGAQRLDEYEDSQVSDQIVRRYLVRILRAIASDEEELVFGATTMPVFQQGTICKERMLEPLAERIHDIALEESGEQEQETVDFLYELAQYLQRTPPEDLSNEFAEFFDLFSGDGESDDGLYIGPGLRTLITVFPSLITNPRLNFAEMGLSETKQFERLVESLGNNVETHETLTEFGGILQEDPR